MVVVAVAEYNRKLGHDDSIILHLGLILRMNTILYMKIQLQIAWDRSIQIKCTVHTQPVFFHRHGLTRIQRIFILKQRTKFSIQVRYRHTHIWEHYICHTVNEFFKNCPIEKRLKIASHFYNVLICIRCRYKKNNVYNNRESKILSLF